MAARRKIGELAQFLLAQHMQRRNMDHQSGLVQERQTEMAELQNKYRTNLAEDSFANTVLSKVVADPKMARRLQQNGQQGIAGFPMDAFVETQSELEAPGREAIGKVDDPSKMPSVDATIGSRLSQGPITELGPLSGTLQQREGQLGRLRDEQMFQDDRTLGMAEGTSRAQSYGQATGASAGKAETVGQDISTANQLEAGTRDAKLLTLQKGENIKAAIELRTQGRLFSAQLLQQGRVDDMKFAQEMLQKATQVLPRMNEVIALAEEVNSGFSEGGMDFYSGIKDSLGSLPYVGDFMRTAQTAMGAAGTAIADGDPTIIRKMIRLEGLRREAAGELARAAGMTPVSDTDIKGILPSLPGAMESREASAEKSAYMRSAVMLLPTLLAENPGMRGKELLDLAFTRSRDVSLKRVSSTAGSMTGRTAPPQPVGPPSSVQSILSR